MREVNKEEEDECYATTTILQGEALLLVHATGTSTKVGRQIRPEMGRAKQQKRKFGTMDHVFAYKKALSSLGLVLILIYVISSCIFRNTGIVKLVNLMSMLIVALTRRNPQSWTAIRASGTSRLMEQGCHSARDDSSDSLAGVDTLLVDRTGTIMENNISIIEPYCVPDKTVEDLVPVTGLCSILYSDTPDFIDRAYLRWLELFPAVKTVARSYQFFEYQSFNLVTRRMGVLVQTAAGQQMWCMRGAPKAILDLCSVDITEEVAEEYRDAAKRFAEHGYRSLGVAQKRDRGPWELLGLTPLYNPPRANVRKALTVARQLGVSVKMMTGDAAVIARKSIENVWVDECKVTLADPTELREKDAEKQFEEANIFAECSRERRLGILSILRAHGQRVAIVGDSFAEKPSLEQADCGIAVAGATTSAMDSADIISRKPGISGLINAIKISRHVFQQLHDNIVTGVVCNTFVVPIVLWLFATYGEVFSIGPLLLRSALSELVRSFYRSGNDSSYSLRPAQWSLNQILAESVPLTSILTIGAWLSLCTHQRDKTLPFHEAQSMLILYIVFVECWLPLVVGSGVPLRARGTMEKQAALVTLVQGLLTVASVYGLIGTTQQLSAMDAFRVWLVGSGTFQTALLYRRISCKRGTVAALPADENEVDTNVDGDE